MSDSPPAVLITVTLRDDDGRLQHVPVLPPEGAVEDMVPTWEPSLQTVVWKTASELGFTPTPMILDVPVVDGTGFLMTEGDGTIIVCNVPSTDAA